MSQLSAEANNAIIERIYEAALSPERWQAALDELTQAFGGSSLFYVFEPETHKTPLALAAGFEPSMLNAYQAYYGALNPYAHMAASSPVDTTVFAHDVVAPEIVRKTEFYADCMRPVGASLSHLALKPVHTGNRLAIVSVSPNLKVFERNPDAARLEFDRFRTHIRRALELNRRLGAIEAAESGLQSKLDTHTAAAFLLDDGGRPLYINRLGESLLQGGQVLTVDQSGRLATAAQRDAGALQKLTAPRNHDELQVLRLHAKDSGLPFLAWAVQLPQEDTPGFGRLLASTALAPRSRILLLVTPVDGRAVIEPALIVAAFGVTPAEARLVTALLAGERLSAYASRSRLSPKTARNQLDSVFFKLGVSRQTELMAMILRAVGPFGSLR